MTSGQVDEFRKSLGRCLDSSRFLEDFYDRFVGSSDAVREKFRNTDFDRQVRALRASLQTLAVAAQSTEEGIVWPELDRLAELHSRRGHQIPAEMYDTWLECLVDTARRHDPEFSKEIESAWRETLAKGIDYMRSRY